MEDLLYKGRIEGLDIAFVHAATTRAVNEAVVRHDCDPAAAHILGRATTAALLAAATLPDGHRFNACWKYRGALKTVVVDAGQDGSVRSLISPNQLGQPADAHDELYGEMGELQAVVSKDGKIASSGTTPVSLHDAVGDLAYHYCISDQIETGMAVMIGFNPDPEKPVRLCQGWMIQALPNADLERFDRIRRRMDEPAFRELLGQGGDAEQLAWLLAGDEEGFEKVHMEACPTPEFKCTCNRGKMALVLRSLPIPERMELVQKKEPVAIRCQFCNERYELSIDECIAAWNTKSSEQP